MSLAHGKKTYFALDTLAGALTSVKGAGDSVTYTPATDQPDTTVFGDRSMKRGLVGKNRSRFQFAGFVKGSLAGSSGQVHGKKTRVLLNEFAPSTQIETTTVARSMPAVTTDGYGVDNEENDLKGHIDGSITFSGGYRGAAGEIDTILRTIRASETRGVISIAPSGFAVGNLVDMGALAITEKGVQSPLQGKAMTSVTAPCDGEVDLGVSLHDTTAETTTFDGTAVDETAATANGGVGHLHCTAFTGTTGTWKIQHSPDNSAWSDLIAFAAVTAVGSQRIELAEGTAVERYVRAICSNDNFSTAIVAIVFGRRDFAYGTAGTHRHFVGLVHKDAAAGASTSASYGAEGNATGKPSVTCEVYCVSYSVTYPHNAPSKFTADFVATGAVADGTY
jgi:hypothetical protein